MTCCGCDVMPQAVVCLMRCHRALSPAPAGLTPSCCCACERHATLSTVGRVKREAPRACSSDLNRL